MASVWEAHDDLLDRRVAVKVLASHLGEDDRARRRFAREARTAAGLSSHPNVVTIYDVGEHDGKSFIVMELVPGGTVADRLRAGERISHRVALRWLAEAGSALDAAHEAGIVHRDVKPANMLLDAHGRLALADFGIARLGLEDQITQTGQVLGTAAYISPEQAMGEPATAASDRYSLAVVSFELLCGSRPFTAENFAAQARAHVEDEPPRASELDIDVPVAADRVLARGMAKEPEDRWETAAGFVRALDDALAAPRARRRAATEPTRVMGATAPPRGADGGRPRRAGAAAPPRSGDGARPRRAGATAAPRSGDGAPPRRDGAAPRRAAGVPPRRSWGAVAAIGLVALLLVLAAAIAFTRGGDREQGERTPRQQQTATATPDRTVTPEDSTRTASPEPTADATQEPTPDATQEPQKGEGEGKAKGKDKPAATGEDPAPLQLQAFQLNNAGRPEEALPLAERAVELCAGSDAVSPCAYALYEYARALRMTGDPERAIQVLEERKARFPGDQADAVERELRLARDAAGGG